ncbi:dimethylallyltransferase [Cellvibrio zantedeschiae]|uniref:Dimethylallyltransferase n=1 Tax=Cellvibrio zantedeschiae TaxID=1237077 RepID=A0ABQ3B5Z0_9GAMM|nr:type 1 glutamine amidotransferase domain-containing protein [Cellvibrio zantedeschiae]GGY79798.1 dimethylallyltransferase [Cellvibrio zantedeschiae]
MSLKDINKVNSQVVKKIALVIANPDTSTTTQFPVGFWWSELTHPYMEFIDAGYAVDIFSPQGGECIADTMSDPNDASGYSRADLISQGFINTSELAALVKNTKSVEEISVADYDAIFVAGGQSPMFSFASATSLHKKFMEFYNAQKLCVALCHGTALLKYLTLADGTALVKGKTVTAFANLEEDFADNAVWSYGILPQGQHLMPWRIEDSLRELGANYVQAGMWRSFAIRDGNLITGQQNFSGRETAQLLIQSLGLS